MVTLPAFQQGFIASGIISATGVMTGTDVIVTAPIPLKDWAILGIHLTWTDTPEGEFVAQVSNDGENWIDLPVVVSDAAGAMDLGGRFFNLAELGAVYARIQYTNTASDGELTCTVKERSA